MQGQENATYLNLSLLLQSPSKAENAPHAFKQKLHVNNANILPPKVNLTTSQISYKKRLACSQVLTLGSTYTLREKQIIGLDTSLEQVSFLLLYSSNRHAVIILAP